MYYRCDEAAMPWILGCYAASLQCSPAHRCCPYARTNTKIETWPEEALPTGTAALSCVHTPCRGGGIGSTSPPATPTCMVVSVLCDIQPFFSVQRMLSNVDRGSWGGAQ